MSKITVVSAVLSDDENTSDDEDICLDDPELANEPDASVTDDLERVSDVESDSGGEDSFYLLTENYVSKNGLFEWERISAWRAGKPRAASTMTGKLGVQSQAAARIQVLRNSFDLFFTAKMKACIIFHTNVEGIQRYAVEWIELGTDELDAFLGVLILQGVFKDNTVSTEVLWSRENGRCQYNAAMLRKRFNQIRSALRFDEKSSREERRKLDKMTHIRDLVNLWTPTLTNNFRPYNHICVDEQLFPFKGRCPFKQYIPSKPRSKYGLKVWILADCRTSFCCNFQLYTGKPPGGAAEKNQGARVVLDLVDYLGNRSSRNVTCDNFFTTIQLAEDLLKRNMTLVGTMRKNKPEIPALFLPHKDRPLFSSLFGFTPNLTLTSYVPRLRKSVILLSSLHHDGTIEDSNSLEKKPEIVTFYNQTKAAVDTMDQLVSTYSVRRKTNRWPMALFYDMVDISALNAYVVWKELDPTWMQGKSRQRSLFLMDLGKALIVPFLETNRSKITGLSLAVKKTIGNMVGNLAVDVDVPVSTPPITSKRLRCELCPRKSDRKSDQRCHKCKKIVCLTHSVVEKKVTCNSCKCPQ